MDTFVQQLINGLTIGSIYALIALGYTMVYGILRLINFAHGDIYMVGAYAGFMLATVLGFAANPSIFAFAVTLFGAMTIAAALGMAIERFAYRPVRKFSKMTTLITAIGMSLLIEYLFIFFFEPKPRSFPPLISNENHTLFGNAHDFHFADFDFCRFDFPDDCPAIHHFLHENRQGDARRFV